MSGAFQQVYDLVRKIPRGKVLTYGLVSHLLDGRLSAQGVGWALHGLAASHDGSSPVPWHRVINSKGQLSTSRNPDIPPGLQRHLMEAEGIKFDREERIVLDQYLWHEGIAELTRKAAGKGRPIKR